MTGGAWQLLVVYLVALVTLAWPLARIIEAVMTGRFAFGRAIEAPLYRLVGVNPVIESGFVRYGSGLVLFNALGLLAVYALQRLQGILPFNPQAMAAVAPDAAFNTAVSFVTNTNWQSYAGEATMSYLTQTLAFTVQNFLSAATGIVVAIALVRGFARHATDAIGNVWVDLTRVTLWILLPLSFVFALALVGLGVVQNLSPSVQAHTLDSSTVQMPMPGASPHAADSMNVQTIAMGPIASQVAIKMIGTNGGGFTNANAAHPFENPTAFSNFLQMLSIFLIPTALTFVFGRMVGDPRQGYTLIIAMTVLFAIGAIGTMTFEQEGNARLTALGADQLVSISQSGGNMEGKEVRFGVAASSLFAAITTAASCGAVNAMHDSFTPLGGGAPLVLMQLGEVVFGGVGSGLYGMLVFAIMAVFIAGLMIGRTPEYLGKKIEAYEMKMVAIAILVTPLFVLIGTALAVSTQAGRAAVLNPGAHGFSEILYALTSAGNNNGSAFAGLSANTLFYNTLLAAVMWFGRFGVIVPVLAIAGSFAAKKRAPVTVGTLPTHGPLFVALLIGVVLLLGLLNYVPALALGPGVEQLMLGTP